MNIILTSLRISLMATLLFMAGCNKKTDSSASGNNQIIASDDAFSIDAAAGGQTQSVLKNDIYNGAAATEFNIILTPGTAPAPAKGSITMASNGIITVAANTTAGTYTYNYTICDKQNSGKCATAAATITVTAVQYNYTPDYTHNLNVIYFVTSDRDTNANYHQRLSEIMLNAQSFYGQWMNYWGYGNKSFGLIKDAAKGRIKLIVIKANRPSTYYPYSGTAPNGQSGSANAMDDVNAWFAAHPSDKTSDHNLIIFAVNERLDQCQSMVVDVPFYGLGRNCFALDFPGMSVSLIGTQNICNSDYSSGGWIGGMMHELGHGLNLPHNRQKAVSEASLGMSLMWSGNSVWGRSPVFLTSADCAVLNVNQVFNNNTSYAPVSSSIQRIHANYDAASASIIVSGKFTSSENISDVLVFNDPNVNNEGTGANTDYNAIVWRAPYHTNDSFRVVMPISDLVEKADGMQYQMKIKLVFTNGVVNETVYGYKFQGGVPVISFSTKNELPKNNWSIVSFSSEEIYNEGSNGRIAEVIDNDVSTYWHSRWSSNSAVYPHWFIVDIGSAQTAKGFSVVQRQGLSRAIKDADISISNDGTNFTSAGSYVLGNSDGPQYFDFASPQTFRYIKFAANTAWDGNQFAALAEFGLYP